MKAMGRKTYRWLAVLAVAAAAVGAPLGAQTASAQEKAAFESTETGFKYSVTGAGDVEAIANSLGMAIAETTGSQALIGNYVEQNNVNSRTLIRDSVRNNAGIITINQESGNINNQANSIAVALIERSGPTFVSLNNTRMAISAGNTLLVRGGHREDRIENSLQNTRGIVAVNQTSGNLNQQSNALALGVGLRLGTEAVSVADGDLGQISLKNSMVKDESDSRTRMDILVDSFGGFFGIAQISQSAGDSNIVSNTAAVSITRLEAR